MINAQLLSFQSLTFKLVMTAAFAVLGQVNHADDYGKSFVDLNPDAFVFVNPNLVKWPDNRVEWLYKTNGRIEAETLIGHINKAAGNLAQRANIAFSNSGPTSLNLLNSYDASRRNTLLIEVLNNSEMDSYVAGITAGETTNGSSFSGFAWMWWNGSVLAGQIALNSDRLNSASCWEGILTHELGHILNLAHSDKQDSIMFAQPYNSCEFQKTPRYDDITALHQMYPKNEANYEATITDEGCLYIPNIEYQGVNYQIRKLCNFQIEGDAVIVNTQ